MNVYELAKKMELEGEEYYNKLAESAKDKGLKKIFRDLAEDERKHYKIIDNIENNIDFCHDTYTKQQDNTIFTNRFELDKINIIDKSQIKAYEHAAALEKESINFYNTKIKEAESDCESMLFNILMKEEKKHLEALEFLIRHLRNAQEWVESAEFTHGEEY